MSINVKKTLMAAAGAGGGIYAYFIHMVRSSIYYDRVDASASLSNGDLVFSLSSSDYIVKLNGSDFSVDWETRNTTFAGNLGFAVDSDDVIYVASLRTASTPDQAIITKINSDGTNKGYTKYWQHSDNINNVVGYNAFVLYNGAQADALVVNTSRSGYDYVGINGNIYNESNLDTSVFVGGFGTGGTIYSADKTELDYLVSIAGKDNGTADIFTGHCQSQGNSLSYRTFQYRINGVDKRSDYPIHFTDPSVDELYMCCMVDLDYTVFTKFDSIRSASSGNAVTFAYNSVGRGFRPMAFFDIDDGMMYAVHNISNTLAYIFKVDTSDMSLVWEYSVTSTNSNFLPYGYGKGFKKADTGEIGFGFEKGAVLLFSPDGLPEGTFTDMTIAESNNGEKTDLVVGTFVTYSPATTSATSEFSGDSLNGYSSSTTYSSSSSLME